MTTAVRIAACIQPRDSRGVAADPEKLAVARRITQARERAGLNRSQLAKACGTTWAHVDRWEGTEKPTMPGPVHLARIAEATGTTVDWLLGQGAEAVVERAPAYPALADFLATEEGRTVSPPERAQLEAQRWKNPPTRLSYHYLLSAIRAGVAPEAAKAEAEITAEAHRRAVARGGRPLQKAKR